MLKYQDDNITSLAHPTAHSSPKRCRTHGGHQREYFARAPGDKCAVALDSETMRDCVLHMYLNECKSGKDKQWYATTQKAFLRHHPQWKDGFDDILKSRWEHGLKSQRTNQMGDWIALSQLGGEPLSLDLLFREKLRHPRDPRPPTHCFPSIDRCSQRRRFYRGVCFRNDCDAPLGARFVHQRRIGLDVHGPVPRTR